MEYVLTAISTTQVRSRRSRSDSKIIELAERVPSPNQPEWLGVGEGTRPPRKITKRHVLEPFLRHPPSDSTPEGSTEHLTYIISLGSVKRLGRATPEALQKWHALTSIRTPVWAAAAVGRVDPQPDGR